MHSARHEEVDVTTLIAAKKGECKFIKYEERILHEIRKWYFELQAYLE